MQSGDAERKKAYAAKPDEPVASFKLVSTIMPQGAGRQPYTYRVALGIALALTVITAALGVLPVAIMIAAFAIPIVYILYLYDVNLWEDEPVPVVAAAFVVTGVLAAVFTWLWSNKLGLSIELTGENAAGPSGRDLVGADPADRAALPGLQAPVRRPDGRADFRRRGRCRVRLLRDAGVALELDQRRFRQPRQ
jgi:hypothetical protein